MERSSESAFRLTVLGARGSMPIEGDEFSRYGGATSCFRVRAGDEEIFLDASSGIVNAKPQSESRLTILLTHMHLDHIVGLPFFAALMQSRRPIDIYARPREGLTLSEALERLISPPIWPLKLEGYPADVKFRLISDLEDEFELGDVTVEMMEGNHPNGSTIFKLTRRGRSIVYATDFEHSSVERCEALIKFAADCDLLMYDAQYTSEEYERCRGFGHSTAEVGLEIATRARASRLMFVHHSPGRTDDELERMEREFSARNGSITFAKLGDEICL